MGLIKLLKFEWKYLKDDKKKLWEAAILYILFSIAIIFYGYLIGRATEAITNSDIKMFITALGTYLFLQVLCELYFIKRSSLLFNNIQYNFITRISKDIYKKALELPAKVYEEKSSGEIINRIVYDTEAVSELVNDLFDLLVEMLGSLLVIAYIFYNSYIVGIEVIIYLIVIALITKKNMKIIKANRAESTALNDSYVSEVNQSIHGIREVKALGIEGSTYENVANFIERTLIKKNYTDNFQTKNYFNVRALNGVFVTIVFLTCGILAYYKISSLTFFIAMTVYVYRYMTTIERWTTFCAIYQNASVAIERIGEVLTNKLYENQCYGNKVLDNIKGEVEFRNVSFGYEKEQCILRELSLNIKANQRVAIVGKSGQGKSTIFNLLLRFFDVQQGEILIDGVNIQHLTEVELRKHISIIRQEPYLFNKTIKENFEMVKPEVTLEQIREYCKKAYIDDYIMSLENKYDTLIGEGGVNLSGGQKQRLAIARTLMKQSKVILFDEATSALDNESQEFIKKTIDSLAEDHTVIIIAHRLSTIVDADSIFFLEQGKVVDSGTHKELMERNEAYRNLYRQDTIK
jgi:ATP-binding cassette, subfamily B, bacterial